MRNSILAILFLSAVSHPALANETCMKIVYSGPKTENAELAKNEVFQFKVPASQRAGIARKLEECLNSSYAAGRAPYGYKQWYTKKDGGFDYCASYNPIVNDGGILVHCDHVASLPNGMFPGQ